MVKSYGPEEYAEALTITRDRLSKGTLVGDPGKFMSGVLKRRALASGSRKRALYVEMSIPALLAMEGLGGGERMLWWALRTLAGPHSDYCRPTYPQLEALTGDSDSTIRRQIDSLEAAGRLKRVKLTGRMRFYPLPCQNEEVTDPEWVTEHRQDEVAGPQFEANPSNLTANPSSATSETFPIKSNSYPSLGAVAIAPFVDEDRTEALERRLRQLEDQLSSPVRETYGFPHPSSENGVNPEGSQEPEIRDVYSFREALNGNAPYTCLNNEFVKRQFEIFKTITDPDRRSAILEWHEFYRDPSKPGGWGMRNRA